LETNKWIRIVNDGGCEISLKDINFKNGKQLELLDIIEVPVKGKEPLNYQPENYLLNNQYCWDYLGKTDYYYLEKFLDKDSDYIFFDESDRLSKNQSGINKSLMLIKIKQINFIVTKNIKQNKQLRAKFNFNNRLYDLAVTDINYENKYLNKDFGEYVELDDFYLTLSLGEPFNNYHYKLIAAVIPESKYK